MLEETQRVYAAAFERVPYPDLEAMKLGLTQVSETNPKVRGVIRASSSMVDCCARSRRAASSSGCTARRGSSWQENWPQRTQNRNELVGARRAVPAEGTIYDH